MGGGTYMKFLELSNTHFGFDCRPREVLKLEMLNWRRFEISCWSFSWGKKSIPKADSKNKAELQLKTNESSSINKKVEQMDF